MHSVTPGQGIRVLILIVTILAASAPPIASLPVKKTDKNLDKANARLFAYDQSVSFDLKEESVKEQEGVTLRDCQLRGLCTEARTHQSLSRPASRKRPFRGRAIFSLARRC